MIPKILCTLGPSSLNKRTVERLDRCGVSCFRINLSHTPLARVEPTIQLIRQFTDKPICVDTEGAQVRTGQMQPGVEVDENQRLRLTAETVLGTAEAFTLTPPEAIAALRPGDMISVDFDSVLLRALDCGPGQADAIVVVGGRVGSNRAVSFYPPPPLPALSKKDVAAILVSRRLGIRDFALSFANAPEDVRALRELAGPEATIIAKIESQRGVRNLSGILAEADAVLIDRGDLSREVPLENLPLLQKFIIRKANCAGVPVYVATNLLESMISQRKPTRAEVNDIANTLLDGAAGLVLAAETAIGDHPIRAAEMVVRIRDAHLQSLEGFQIDNLLNDSSSLLPNPHGASKRCGFAHNDEMRGWLERMAASLPVLELEPESILELEQLADGTLAPLRHLMSAREVDSVIDSCRLLSGETWAMPVVLQAPCRRVGSIAIGATISLACRTSGRTVAVLHVEDKSEIDLENLACRWYGTADEGHPGVRALYAGGEAILAGPIEWLAPPSAARSPFRLTPAQTRMIFEFKGWSRVFGINVARPPQAADASVLCAALADGGADGLLVNLLAPIAPFADDPAAHLVPLWQQFLEAHVPHSLLNLVPCRPAGCPRRELAHWALCLKNFGCTHYLIDPSQGTARQPQIDGVLLSPADPLSTIVARNGDLGIAPVVATLDASSRQALMSG